MHCCAAVATLTQQQDGFKLEASPGANWGPSCGFPFVSPALFVAPDDQASNECWAKKAALTRVGSSGAKAHENAPSERSTAAKPAPIAVDLCAGDLLAASGQRKARSLAASPRSRPRPRGPFSARLRGQQQSLAAVVEASRGVHEIGGATLDLSFLKSSGGTRHRLGLGEADSVGREHEWVPPLSQKTRQNGPAPGSARSRRRFSKVAASRPVSRAFGLDRKLWPATLCAIPSKTTESSSSCIAPSRLVTFAPKPSLSCPLPFPFASPALIAAPDDHGLLKLWAKKFVQHDAQSHSHHSQFSSPPFLPILDLNLAIIGRDARSRQQIDAELGSRREDDVLVGKLDFGGNPPAGFEPATRRVCLETGRFAPTRPLPPRGKTQRSYLNMFGASYAPAAVCSRGTRSRPPDLRDSRALRRVYACSAWNSQGYEAWSAPSFPELPGRNGRVVVPARPDRCLLGFVVLWPVCRVFNCRRDAPFWLKSQESSLRPPCSV
ncbi:hypothetical protein MIND_01248400 [Mycena indigotica]|uniref:Uncharacterized protein n=1 Tax=Mycena indigotica TaxID=2126181 RepID=A0A8H6S532_9AGAR|nr:uncharacterized protein MIND_01248400 [Mycena indigotica]KAF7292211.1 hypothetical protein MIND_01248400 [Mycena indigotica]